MFIRVLLSVLLLMPIIAKAQTPIDIGVAEVGPVDYLTPGTHEFWIGGECFSGGFSNLNAIEVGWSFNGGAWQSYSATTRVFTPAGRRFELTIPVTPKIIVTQPGQYILKVFVKSSSITDPDATNDTMVKVVHVHNTLPPKNVLFEVLKFQRCTPCYKGDTAVNGQILPKPYVNIARLYISKGELLYNATADTIDNAVGVAGHPNFMYDRFRWPYRTTPPVDLTFQSSTVTTIKDSGHRVRFLEPLSVAFESVRYDSATREVYVSLKATVFDTLEGDHRFNAYITEDSIRTFQSGAPSGMPYWHIRVMRAALGNAWGTKGSMPQQLLPGQTYSYSYNYTLPNHIDPKYVRVVGFVQLYDKQDSLDRRILNSVGGELLVLDKTTGMQTVSNDSEPLNIYPNPANDVLHVKWHKAAGLQLRIMDMTGKLIREWYDKGNNITVPLGDMPDGQYTLQVNDGQRARSAIFYKKK